MEPEIAKVFELAAGDLSFILQNYTVKALPYLSVGVIVRVFKVINLVMHQKNSSFNFVNIPITCLNLDLKSQVI